MAWSLLDNPQVVDLDYGGAAGGGKSLFVCLWSVVECRKYAGIRIGIGRKELKRLKETTLVSLLREAHPILGVSQASYTYNDQKAIITYANGSQIILIDLAYQPSDPDYDTFGGLLLTHVIIEEAGEVRKKAKDVLSSRKNRWMNKEYKIVGKTILTQNPSQNFTKEEYYTPYKKLGMGDMQKWPSGQVELPDGTMAVAYKVFIKALPTDNPFLSRNYIEILNQLPTRERKRLREGDWDYNDDDNMLFKSYVLDRSSVAEFQPGRKVLGVDISDKGKDATIASLIENHVLVSQESVPIDKESAVTIGDQIANWIIRKAQENGIQPKDVGFDVIGVGVTTRDSLRRRGWFCQEFDAGAAPADSKSKYRKARDERFFVTANKLEAGSLKIHAALSTQEELRKQLQAHEDQSDDSNMKITPKEKVKEQIGRSPDHADSFIIADWVDDGAPTRLKESSGKIIF